MSSFFFSSRRRNTRFDCDWSSDVCSSDLYRIFDLAFKRHVPVHVPEHAEGLEGEFSKGHEQRDLLRSMTVELPHSIVRDRSEERRVGKECRSRGLPYA